MNLRFHDLQSLLKVLDVTEALALRREGCTDMYTGDVHLTKTKLVIPAALPRTSILYD